MSTPAHGLERYQADVAVVGGGPAGLAAAAAAAEQGARTLLVDAQTWLGGQLWRGAPDTQPRLARRWLRRLERSAAGWLGNTRVVDARARAAHGFRLLAGGPAGARVIDARSLVLACGARELWLPFPGWTLPEVLGPGAAQALLKSGGVWRGRRALVAGSGPLLWPVAAALAHGGAQVTGVVEQASLAALWRFALAQWRSPATLWAAAGHRLRFARARLLTGCWVLEAHGRERVEAVTLTDGKRAWREPCDLLACAYGLVPNTELGRLLGCAPASAENVPAPAGAALLSPAQACPALACDTRQATSVTGVFAAGEVCGVGGAELAQVEGEIAGISAAQAAGARATGFAALRLQWLVPVRTAGRARAQALDRAFAPRAELRDRLRGDTLVCRCENVPWSALQPFAAARPAKLATRAGMGACQGRVCGAALAVLRGFDADSVRAPLEPLPLGVLAALDAADEHDTGGGTAPGAAAAR